MPDLPSAIFRQRRECGYQFGYIGCWHDGTSLPYCAVVPAHRLDQLWERPCGLTDQSQLPEWLCVYSAYTCSQSCQYCGEIVQETGQAGAQQLQPLWANTGP